MSLLHTIALLLLFLPGVSFRKAYLTNPYSFRHKFTNVVNEIVVSFLISVLLHLFFIYISKYWGWKFVDEPYKVLTKLNIPLESGGLLNDINSQGLNWSSYNYFIYVLLVTVSGYFLGIISWYIVARTRLDLICPCFKFNNALFYSFTTRIPFRKWTEMVEKGLRSGIQTRTNSLFNPALNQTQVNEIRNELNTLIHSYSKFSYLHKRIYYWYKDSAITSRVDLLVQMGDKLVIYKGQLYKPNNNTILFDREGNIESILLKNVSKLSYDPNNFQQNSPESKIQGNSTAFKYDTIINFNVRYFSINILTVN